MLIDQASSSLCALEKKTLNGVGFIQNCCDAPLLLQWGEGDIDASKVFCW